MLSSERWLSRDEQALPADAAKPQPIGSMIDRHGRPLRSLRISVTDRCNLRCSYCMPEEEYVWLPRLDLLSFEELDRLVGVFVRLGVDRLRLTGGEPLLRRDLHALVAHFARREGIKDLAMTTNATRLEAQAEGLRAAGLHRLTVSLDTLRPDRFEQLTRRNELEATLRGIDAAVAAKYDSVKINCVVMRGENDDEIADLLRYARERGIELRFIEYMDVGGATQWSESRVVPKAEILTRIASDFGKIRAYARDSAPADRFELEDGTRFGIIASTTEPFCASCDRARVTADGRFFTCLYAREGLDLRQLLRSPANDDDLVELLNAVWHRRTDKGAEERLALHRRQALAGADELRDDPHLEMHTRGG